MKIIDLLNKIANGEEVPKKIKYEGDILEYDEDDKDYTGLSKTWSGVFFSWLFGKYATDKFINNEVEIIEDNEIDIQNIEEIKINESCLNPRDIIINKLVQAVKQLDEKKEDK